MTRQEVLDVVQSFNDDIDYWRKHRFPEECRERGIPIDRFGKVPAEYAVRAMTIDWGMTKNFIGRACAISRELRYYGYNVRVDMTTGKLVIKEA